jgi:dTDP-glucose pyrophosphorylase
MARGPLTAVILAAGAGRRLGGVGMRTSKAMLPVLGRPLVAWVAERLRQAGIERLVVVAHATDAALREAESVLGLPAQIVIQHERNGIAAAVVQALPAVAGCDAFVACACDSIFDAADIRALIAAGSSAPGSAVVAVQNMGVEATATRSAVEVVNGRITRLIEKPAPGSTRSPLVALPLYWLPAGIDPYLRAATPVGGERHISTALNAFLAAGGTVRAQAVRRRIEITTAADVPRAEEMLRS